MYIAFKLNNKNIIALKLFVNSVNIYLHCKYGTLKDEYNLARDIKSI
jgi:predicted transport protein